MKIKTTQKQIEGVALLLSYLVINNKPTNIAERLVYSHVHRLFLKVRNRVDALNTSKSGWGISMTDDEAMSLYIFLQNVEIPTEAYKYEAIQMLSISNQIHNQFAS